MVIKLITPDTIAFRASITEEELRERMRMEVLEQINGLAPDGRPLPGLTVRITKSRNRAGGYDIEVSGPAPARIFLPAPGGAE
jgi:hypothetical protein